jgi:hypothetical protein
MTPPNCQHLVCFGQGGISAKLFRVIGNGMVVMDPHSPSSLDQAKWASQGGHSICSTGVVAKAEHQQTSSQVPRIHGDHIPSLSSAGIWPSVSFGGTSNGTWDTRSLYSTHWEAQERWAFFDLCSAHFPTIPLTFASSNLLQPSQIL